MDTIKTGDNILLNLFSNLTYDIQEKIYNYTLIEKQKQYNKRMFSGEYTLHFNAYKENKIFLEYLIDCDMINYLYEDYCVGKRVVKEHSVYVDIDKSLDKEYYSDLDHIFKCDLTTTIDIENVSIEHKYKIKDNYKHLSLNNREKKEPILVDTNGYGDSEDEELIDEDDWGLQIQKEWSNEYHLTDWLIEKIDCFSICESEYEFVCELIDSNYEMIERDTECLKRYLFDLKSSLNVFYNCKENRDYYFS